MDHGTNENMLIQRLSPLDLLVPPGHVQVNLIFQTSDSTESILAELQLGLDKTVKHFPWLAGHVFHADNMSNGQQMGPPYLELRVPPNAPGPVIVDKGTINHSYDAMSISGMAPSGIPPDVSPVAEMAKTNAASETGTQAFGVTLFRFSDNKAVGLCLCVQHNVTDGTGLENVTKVWACNIQEGQSSNLILKEPSSRSELLSKALAGDLEMAQTQSLESLIAKHPEFSTIPPDMPSVMPSSTSKVFGIPKARLERLRESLAHTTSLNTVLCAFLWAAITRARGKRPPAAAAQTEPEKTQLLTIVNGRPRIFRDDAGKGATYPGNAVLYAKAESPMSRQDICSDDSSSSSSSNNNKLSPTQIVDCLCQAINTAQSLTNIDSAHIAEVYTMWDQVSDYRASLFPGWDLFNSRDLSITSWANQDLYLSSWGSRLGRPQFVRPPYIEADGVCILLPRRREGVINEVVEVMVALRRDDMETLELDPVWRDLIN